MAGMYGVDWSSSDPPAGPVNPALARSPARALQLAPAPRPGVVTLGLLCVYALTSALASLAASQLVWNRTPSLPLGIYAKVPVGSPSRGELVALRVPASVRQLVHERRYLADGSLLIKPVAAVAGDWVCRGGYELFVNGRRFGTVLSADTEGRPLPSFGGCQVLGDGQVFLASPHPRSFDSRTFGPVDVGALQGTVIPLWTY
jgi:conjugative transfer signal peptidase TraF